jgi:hypothetical protein
LVARRMVAMIIVAKLIVGLKLAVRSIAVQVARRIAAPLRSLVAARVPAHNSVADRVALVASTRRCMLGQPKAVAKNAAPKVSVPHRVAMTNVAARKVIAGQKVAAQKHVALVDRRHVAPKVVATMIVVQKRVPKVAALKPVRHRVVRKAEAKDASPKPVARKVVAKIADQKVAVQKLDRRHVAQKLVLHRVVPKDAARKVADPKHAAMMIAAPKVVAPVVRRVAKAQAVAKVAVVHRHPAMTM